MADPQFWVLLATCQPPETCVEGGPVLIHAEPRTGYLTQTDTWIGYVS